MKEEKKINIKSKATKLNEENLVQLGAMVDSEHPAIKSILEWAKLKYLDVYTQLDNLAANKDLTERAVGILLGEARALKKDLGEFLSLAKSRYVASTSGRERKEEE